MKRANQVLMQWQLRLCILLLLRSEQLHVAFLCSTRLDLILVKQCRHWWLYDHLHFLPNSLLTRQHHSYSKSVPRQPPFPCHTITSTLVPRQPNTSTSTPCHIFAIVIYYLDLFDNCESFP